MRDPSRLACRSMYSFTPVRNSMNPSVTVSRKIRVEIAHSTKVCSAVAGPYSPKLKETCHTTSVTRSGGRPNENKQNPPPLSVVPRLICDASTLQNHHRQRLPGGMRDGERDVEI